MTQMRRLVAGAAAGAAGTTALNAVTYLDMAVRGRAASSTPEQTVQKLAGLAGVDLPGDEETRRNRLQGLGPLLGLATGVAAGAAYGLFTAAFGRPPAGAGALLVASGAMVAANGPMAVLGISDPRRWTPGEWASDVVPHVAFGLVTAYTYDAIQG